MNGFKNKKKNSSRNNSKAQAQAQAKAQKDLNNKDVTTASRFKMLAIASALVVGLTSWMMSRTSTTPKDANIIPDVSTTNGRSEVLPLLDQLFPHQSLDSAWEAHPLLSTIYDTNKGDTGGSRNFSETPPSKISRNGNQIPTVHLEMNQNRKQQHEQRLDLAQALFSTSNIEEVLYPASLNGQEPPKPLEPGKDFNIVKKMILASGDEWTGISPMAGKGQVGHAITAPFGFSLIINQLQKRWGAVSQMARQLERESLPEHVSCNLYLTPPPPPSVGSASRNEPPAETRQAGFESHWDWMDVIVVQLQGEKLWSVAKKPRVELSNQDQKYKPTSKDMEDYLSFETGRFEEFLLRPGDVLYIPRGFMHNASTVLRLDDDNSDNGGPQKRSLHLTFGMEHGCQTTVEALVHHAIETHAASEGMHANTVAIFSPDCPAAGGRDILWKHVLHYGVAEVARRHFFCQTSQPEQDKPQDDTPSSPPSSSSSCLLRKSIPLSLAFKQVHINRQGKNPDYLVDRDDIDVVNAMLIDALSVVHDLIEPELLSRFVERLELGEEENIRTFCNPFMTDDSTTPCPKALAQLDEAFLRTYVAGLQGFVELHYVHIQRQVERHVEKQRLHKWKNEDKHLNRVGQL